MKEMRLEIRLKDSQCHNSNFTTMTMLQQCFVLMLVLLTTSAAADGEVAEGESIHVNTISKSESCRHKVANDDRLYLWYSGIEHDTAELFDSNRGLGDSAFIMRVGEPNVLKGMCCISFLHHYILFVISL
jgi:hypothetical protein